ncbi:hypothetical protein QMZ05_11180 [Bradyrhizobium sp. INPA03-11B]|uniref:hypothetical protein n=1 Tax=Bradyrhizobium sp. INPA03-11B TaxID=418598 RepID=UPI00338F21AD
MIELQRPFLARNVRRKILKTCDASNSASSVYQSRHLRPIVLHGSISPSITAFAQCGTGFGLL